MTRKVVLLSTGLGVGGAETQVVRIAVELRQRGWAVQVVSMMSVNRSAGNLLPDHLLTAGIPLHSLGIAGPLSVARGALALARLLRAFRPDVLVSFMFHANLMGRVVGSVVGVRRIVSSVRTVNFGGPLRYRLMTMTDRLADHTVANSSRVAAALVHAGTVAPSRIRVIRNGITVGQPLSIASTRASARNTLGVEPGEFAWMAIGNLVPPKSYPTLLRAFAILVRESSRNVLRIAGHGPLEESLRELMSELGLSNQVRLLGLRPDAAELLVGADAYVISSTTEGMPNALIEAMLAGLPCVATTVGGIPEIVTDGVTGLLVPGDNADTLATVMRRVVDMSPPERDALGRAARREIVRSNSIDNVVSEWEALFSEAPQAWIP